MSKNKKSTKIRRPGKGINPPEAKRWDDSLIEETPKIDKSKAMKEWFSSAKKTSNTEDGENSVSIDPKQAAYAKKEKKNGNEG